MDGRDAIPDKDLGPRQHRDEFACARVQFEAHDENNRSRPIDPGDESLRGSFYCINLAQLTRIPVARRPYFNKIFQIIFVKSIRQRGCSKLGRDTNELCALGPANSWFLHSLDPLPSFKVPDTGRSD